MLRVLLPTNQNCLTTNQVVASYEKLWQKVESSLDCKTVRIFAYSSTGKQSNKRSRTRLKTVSETGETLRLFTDFFTDFENKTDCFAV